MRTPVVIVTGYLGSGKTTLLRWLVERSGKRLALVLNEFGELSIDRQVLKTRNVEMVELSGGCVCCSLIGDFEAAVQEVIEAVRPEAIVLETTGVAEPDALIVDVRERLPMLLLEAVATVVDAEALLRYPYLGHTGRVQIEMADLILLNKMDLVDRDQVSGIEARLREINSTAPIIKTVRGRIDPAVLFGSATVHSDRIPGASDGHAHRFESFVLVPEGELTRAGLEQMAANLPASIYRAKGFVRVEGGPVLFNYVGGRLELESWPDPEITTGLVFIGEEARFCRTAVEQLLKQACRPV